MHSLSRQYLSVSFGSALMLGGLVGCGAGTSDLGEGAGNLNGADGGVGGSGSSVGGSSGGTSGGGTRSGNGAAIARGGTSAGGTSTGGTSTGGTSAGGSGGSGAGVYEPCGGKSCGDSCRICDPAALDCAETMEEKSCQTDGSCSGQAPECEDSPSCENVFCEASMGACFECADGSYACPSSECIEGECYASAAVCYEPCAGKSCGDSCSICDPADLDCMETMEMKYCDSNGGCSAMGICSG